MSSSVGDVAGHLSVGGPSLEVGFSFTTRGCSVDVGWMCLVESAIVESMRLCSILIGTSGRYEPLGAAA